MSSFIHDPQVVNQEWTPETSAALAVAAAEGQQTAGDALTERLANIDAISPELSTILRSHMSMLQRQQDMLSRMHVEVTNEFRAIRKRLETAVPTQSALQAISNMVANYDGTPAPSQGAGADSTPNGNNKRVGSPLGYAYPAPKNARTMGANGHPATGASAYYNTSPSQAPFPPGSTNMLDYHAPYGMPRTSDMGEDPGDSFIGDQTEHEGHGHGELHHDKGGREKPPEHLFYQPTRFLRRDITSLWDLWKEYTEGLHGKPSIIEMQERYGSRWHTAGHEAVYYSVRKPIYKTIIDLRDNKYEGNTNAAINELKEKMDREHLASIHQLGRALRKEMEPAEKAAREEKRNKKLAQPGDYTVTDPDQEALQPLQQQQCQTTQPDL